MAATPEVSDKMTCRLKPLAVESKAPVFLYQQVAIRVTLLPPSFSEFSTIRADCSWIRQLHDSSSLSLSLFLLLVNPKTLFVHLKTVN